MPRLTAALLLLLGFPGLAQPTPEFVAGHDLPTLRAAVRKDPGNVGLRLRLVQALARPDPETTHPDVAAARLAEIQEQIQAARELAPGLPAPLRFLCLESFRAGDFEKAVQHGEALLLIDPTDTEVARTVLKARMRRREEAIAAAFFADWLQAGAIPSIGALEGLFGSLMVSSAFREAFAGIWKDRLERNPRNPFLHLYQGMHLAEAGRLESAWAALHEAERLGLMDMRTGGRHPYIAGLAGRIREVDGTLAAYDGLDMVEIARLRSQVPSHLGLMAREARLLDLAGRRAEALLLYAGVREGSPEFWPVAYRMGELHFQAGDFPAASAVLDQARARFPHLITLNLMLAEARGRTEDPSGAVDALLFVAERYEAGALTRHVWARISGLAEGAVLRDLLQRMGAPGGNPCIETHRALALWLLGRKDEARVAALHAERVGAAGRDARPAPVLLEVHGLTDPAAEAEAAVGGSGGPR